MKGDVILKVNAAAATDLMTTIRAVTSSPGRVPGARGPIRGRSEAAVRGVLVLHGLQLNPIIFQFSFQPCQDLLRFLDKRWVGRLLRHQLVDVAPLPANGLLQPFHVGLESGDQSLHESAGGSGYSRHVILRLGFRVSEQTQTWREKR